jgi:hypothetical protein
MTRRDIIEASACGDRKPAGTIDIQQPDGSYRRGTWRDVLAAEREQCLEKGVPTVAADEAAEGERR